MGYTPIFDLYPNGWKNKPAVSTPIINTAMDKYDAAIRNIETYLSSNPITESNLNSLSNVEITNPEEGDLLVYDGTTYKNTKVDPKIAIDDSYTVPSLESGFTLLSGGYFCVGENLVIAKIQLNFTTDFSSNNEIKIASGFPTPSFPEGITKSYGQIMNCNGDNVLISGCYINENGELYYKKNQPGFISFGNSGIVSINVQYIKETS